MKSSSPTARALLVFALLLVAGPAFAGVALLPRHPAPSPDGQTIVFSWQGDLWRVPAKGGDAHRLTAHPALDRHPVWSRNGEMIAFASDRHGHADVYVMPADLSEAPRRLTFASTTDTPVDFTPSGDAVLFTSRRLDSARRSPGLFGVPLTGGTPRLEQTALVRTAGYSPSGEMLAFVRGSTPISRRGYRGPGARDLWLRDAEGNLRELTDFDGDDDFPGWVDDETLVFLSSRDGRKNLFRMNIAGGNVRALTKHEFSDARYPQISADGRLVAYEFEDAIWTVSTAGGAPRRVDINVTADPRQNGTEHIVKTADASEMTVSADGKRVAFVVHGDVFVTELRSKDDQKVSKSPTVQVTATPGRERELDWSPDGKTLLYSSEEHGSFDLVTAQPGGGEKDWVRAFEFVINRLTSEAAEEHHGQWSPDGASIAYIEGKGDLRVMNADGSGGRTLLEHWTDSEIAWSPDGKWLAYSVVDVEFNSDIWIISAEGGEPYNVSRHPDGDSQPTWSPDGRRLVWVSYRHGDGGDLWSVWLAQEDHERTAESWLGVWSEKSKKDKTKGKKDKTKGTSEAKAKDKKTDADTEEEPKETKDDDGAGAEASEPELPEVTIDFDGLWRRSKSLTSLEGDERAPFVGAEGRRIFFSASPDGKRDLYSVGWNGKDRKRLTKDGKDPRGAHLDAKGKVIYYRTPKGKLARVKTDGKKGDAIPFSARYELDLAAERGAVFDQAWRELNENFYDPNFHGVDWKAQYEKHRPWALAASHPADFSDVMNLMLGELNASHVGYRARRNNDGETSGWLGAIYDPGAGGPGVRVKEVIPDSPAARRDVRLKAGDRILSIAGVELDATTNLYAALVETTGLPVQLRVQGQAGDVRSVAVTPIAYRAARQLRYRQWTRERGAIVERLSDGRLGYLHIQGMNHPSFEEFERNLYAAGHGKEGLIIDVRSNGGGWTTDYLMAVLNVTRHARTVPRDADPAINAYPQGRLPLAAWTRPALTLINEDSYSNAEIFAHAFHNLGRGKVVGTQTHGAVISTGSTRLVNGASLRLPFRGWYIAGSDLNMELNGAIPDLDVEQPPEEDMGAEKDTQLERAVELFLSEIEDDPRYGAW